MSCELQDAQLYTGVWGKWTMPLDRRTGKVEAGSKLGEILELRMVFEEPAPCQTLPVLEQVITTHQ